MNQQEQMRFRLLPSPNAYCLMPGAFLFAILTAMSDEGQSTERSRNIWAPWRMEYIDSLNDGGPNDGCFLCRYAGQPDLDAPNLVLWRGTRTLTLLNRFPYTGGHSMVAPMGHVADLTALDDATMLEMMHSLRDMQQALSAALHCEGFNIGINIGRCAGAGLPGHLHLHIVPRWAGDTNFMPVFGGARVIPVTLESMYGLLKKTAEQLKLPKSE
jgi:ATP adenylyltransferase